MAKKKPQETKTWIGTLHAKVAVEASTEGEARGYLQDVSRIVAECEGVISVEESESVLVGDVPELGTLQPPYTRKAAIFDSVKITKKGRKKLYDRLEGLLTKYGISAVLKSLARVTKDTDFQGRFD